MTQRVDRPDPEDRFDEFVENLFKACIGWLGRQAWDIADKVFKLTSWMLLIGAIKAVAVKLSSVELNVFAATLGGVWVVIAATLVIQTWIYVQDALTGHLDQKLVSIRNPVLLWLARSASGMVIVGIIGVFVFEFLVPVVATVFTALISEIGFSAT